MMKDVVRAIETGALAEVGLLAFVVAFVIVVVWAFTMSKRMRDAAKQLPLDED
ncbi:MAG TPA: CcoQ/FixQ family Cbb3-type cytochrome c oxidase assembly chaperone [Rhodothermales bacterium]